MELSIICLSHFLTSSFVIFAKWNSHNKNDKKEKKLSVEEKNELFIMKAWELRVFPLLFKYYYFNTYNSSLDLDRDLRGTYLILFKENSFFPIFNSFHFHVQNFLVSFFGSYHTKCNWIIFDNKVFLLFLVLLCLIIFPD